MLRIAVIVSLCSIMVIGNCDRPKGEHPRVDSCVFKALDDRDLKLFSRCLNAENVNGKGDENGETPLTYLLGSFANEEFQKKREFLEVAFRNGADPRMPNAMGTPPICIWQVESGPGFPTTSYLLSKGAGIHDKDAEGNTYLYDMLIPEAEIEFSGFYRAIDFFVANGGDLNTVNKQGNTVLMHMLRHTLAAEHDFSDIIVYLYKSGIDVNIRNRKGETALLISKNNAFSKESQTNTLVRLGAKP